MVNWSDFDSHITENFTVGEFCNHDRRRIILTPELQKNAIKIITELQKIRDEFGAGITITSGYRPPLVNREVGGARNSQHLYAIAVDVKPSDGSSVYQFQSWLDQHWYGALGYGAKKGFVHLDCRNGKGWKTGGTKGVRWNY